MLRFICCHAVSPGMENVTSHIRDIDHLKSSRENLVVPRPLCSLASPRVVRRIGAESSSRVGQRLSEPQPAGKPRLSTDSPTGEVLSVRVQSSCDKTHRETGHPLTSLGRTSSFRTPPSPKNTAADTLPRVHSLIRKQPSWENSHKHVKRSVSFNLPGENKPVGGRDAMPAGRPVPRLPVFEQILERCLERDCSMPVIRRLLGDRTETGKLAGYQPIVQLRMLKIIFKNTLVLGIRDFETIFQGSREIIDAWPRQDYPLNAAGDSALADVNMDVKLEIPDMFSSRAAIQLQGEAWTSFSKEMLKKIPLKSYNAAYSQLTAAMGTLWPEYRRVILIQMLLYFTLIPKNDDVQIFDLILDCCRREQQPPTYSLAKLLATNVPVSEGGILYKHRVAVLGLCRSLPTEERDAIETVLRLFPERGSVV
ncbi:hypothetical protein [Martelella alba]|uniref:Uncharacterized protein n=1 Tax=Martelella alba TaxID=2590451 RepID=A0ABY2SLQ5_9HYPH|nr:hypothetical protein [Martelella alba]TKI05752.1 hypothetical protein FCN80_12470 [Martelella alba]